MKYKYLLGISLGILLSFGVVGKLSAAGCPPPAISAFCRVDDTGYFEGNLAPAIDWIFLPGISSGPYANLSGLGTPTSTPGGIGDCAVNQCTVTLQSFIQVYHDRLFDSDPVDEGRAAAEIDIMMGQQGTEFPTIASGIVWAQQHFDTVDYTDNPSGLSWEQLVTIYADNEVPNYSVNWNKWVNFNTTVDGMGVHDVPDKGSANNCTPYKQCEGNITIYLEGDVGLDEAVDFNVNGNDFYIKHKCANLTGDLTSLEIPVSVLQHYNLVPTVKVTVNGVPGDVAAVGDTVQFSYSVANTESGNSPNVACDIYRNTFAGYRDDPPPYDTSPAQPDEAGTGCPQSVNGNSTVNLPTDPKFTVTTANQTICSTLSISPADSNGDTHYGEACVSTVALTCGGAPLATPTPDPKTTFSVSPTVDYNPPDTVSTDVIQTYHMYIDVTGPNGFSYQNSDVTPMTVGQGVATATASNIGPTGTTGDFTVTYGLKDSTGAVVINCVASNAFAVADLPYFNIIGGDATAGGGLDQSGTDCAVGPDPKASIVGWNKEAAGNYAGAGTQYAATVLNYLQDFATAQGSSGVPAAPSGLSFANAYDDFGNGIYGGGYGSESCIPDYYSPPSNVSTGNFYINGLNPTGVSTNSSATPITVANGTHTNIYIDGNAYITGNIVYSNNYPNGVSDIPSYTLVVKGNIYIAPGVSQLNGLYVAEPDGPGTGIIYTCATTFAQPNLDGTLYNTCNTSTLTVNGSFIAQQVWLVRTAGTLSTTPAETFNYSPELWLTTPPASGVGITGENTDYDAITGLPPTFK